MVEPFSGDFNFIKNNEFISKAIDLAGVGVVITDPTQYDNPIIYVNRGFEEITGYAGKGIVGQNCRFLQNNTATEQEKKQIRSKMEAGEQVHIVLKNFRKDGTPFWNEININKVYMEELQKAFFIGIQKDITKQKEAEERAQQHLLDIRKLSLPIIPVDKNSAVIPVVGSINEDIQQQLKNKIGDYLEAEDKEYIILDLSGVEEFNEQVNWTIYSLDQLIGLMGANLYISGCTPELVLHSLKGSYDLASIPTFQGLETAISHISRA
ncbi:blue-light photoreceptor [Virgibacillus siamensis]|uniref:Blue-light photoreceptor n=1 Tax=Virgibacillus siamensis TaxID=480071 RepID=A0ABN1FWA0_9BACI